MASKFETLIEYVIANDNKKARSLFHQIVVDKSRKIYEALDMDDTERAFDDVEADHTASDEDFGDEGETEFGGDESDDLQTDVFADGEEAGLGLGGEEGGEELNPEIDDRVADLESEFDALKAEFEELLHAEEGEDESLESDEEGEDEELEGLDSAVEEDGGEEFGDDEETETESETEDFGDGEEETESEEEKEEPVDESVIREYVLKVTKGLSNSSEEGFVQKKSPVSAKPSIVPGITPKNLNQGGTSQGRPNPKSGELIGDKEVVNRPGHMAKLIPAPKKAVNKEEGSVNKKSVEA